MNIKVLGFTDNSKPDSKPTPTLGFIGIGLDTQRRTELLKGMNLSLERELGSHIIVLHGDIKMDDTILPLHFFQKGLDRGIIRQNSLALEVGDINQTVQKTINEIIRKLSPTQTLSRWAIPAPHLEKPFNKITRLNITITSAGKPLPQNRLRQKSSLPPRQLKNPDRSGQGFLLVASYHAHPRRQPRAVILSHRPKVRRAAACPWARRPGTPPAMVRSGS